MNRIDLHMKRFLRAGAEDVGRHPVAQVFPECRSKFPPSQIDAGSDSNCHSGSVISVLLAGMRRQSHEKGTGRNSLRFLLLRRRQAVFSALRKPRPPSGATRAVSFQAGAAGFVARTVTLCNPTPDRRKAAISVSERARARTSSGSSTGLLSRTAMALKPAFSIRRR
jgi:hypothetical protein